MLGAIADNTALDLGIVVPSVGRTPKTQLSTSQVDKVEGQAKQRVEAVADETYKGYEPGQPMSESQIQSAATTKPYNMFDPSTYNTMGGGSKGSQIDIMV